MWKRYFEVGLNVALATGAYYLFGWIGFAIFVLAIFCWFATQTIEHQQMISKTLLSRLPDRCAFCHREIVDEGGTFDEIGIYHNACIDKLEALEDLRKEAGVPSSQAIHKPQPHVS